MIQTKLMMEFNKLFAELFELHTKVEGMLHQISEEEMNKDHASWFESKADSFKNFTENG